MKKTLIYLLVLGVLAGGIYLVFGKKQDGYSVKDSNFTVKDTADIGKVYLAATSGETILIERDEKGWKLNGDYRALQSTVNSLLGTLYLQVGKHPAPGSAHNNIVRSMAGTGIKVEVYDRSNKKIRVFYVGSETRNYEGSYMLMEGSETPFVVEIPGFPGYLTTRYTTNFLDWRDRSIFMLKRPDISRISVTYPAEPLNSFVVFQDKEGKITAQADPVVTANNELNLRRVELFFTFFDKIYSEGFTTPDENVAQVLDTIPKRVAIEVTSTAGATQHLDIYWKPVGRRSRNLGQSDEDTPDWYDADRGYGVLNGKDTVVVQYQAFDKIFRKAWELYEKDKEPLAVGQ